MKLKCIFSLFFLLFSITTKASLTCEDIGKVKTEAELTEVMKTLHKDQYDKIQGHVQKYGHMDRHQLGKFLNGCEAKDDSKGLVISFEGTGSYDPKTFDLYRKLVGCLTVSEVEPNIKKSLYYLLRKFIKTKKREPRWGGISAGPHAQFLKDKEIRKEMKGLQFVSFPSEESELLDGPNGLSMGNLKKIASDYSSSTAGAPKGIANAVKCTAKYLKTAKEKKLNPKLMILTHSSGGRSAVKFAEFLKDAKIIIDFVFSMDPVKEAHEAVKEVVEQYSGNAVRDLERKFSDDVPKNKPVNVWTRSQPKSLYKPSNVITWVNVYQSVDTLGLKGPVEFGIRGSPIYKADVNEYIKDGLGNDAHGGICYHDKTAELFKIYFLKTFP